jgi:hypothetical protein
MAQSDIWTRRLASGWIYWPTCLAGLFMVGLGILGPEADRRLKVESQCTAMQAEVDALRQTRDQLATIEKALQNDPNFTERVVRQELGITRPGEMRLTQPTKLDARPAETPTSTESRILFPPVMESLAEYKEDSWLRLSVLVMGSTLLACGVLLSVPGRRTEVKSEKFKVNGD